MALQTWKLLWAVMVIAITGIVVVNIVTTSSFVKRVMHREDLQNGFLFVQSTSPPPESETPTPKYDPRFDKFAIGIKTGAHIAPARVPIQMMTFLKYQPNVLYFGDDDSLIGDFKVDGVLKDKVPRSFYPHKRHLLSSTDTVKADQTTIGWKLDQQKHFYGFKRMYELFPDKEWYIMIDDDTYLFMDNIEYELSRINSSEIWYFGTPRLFKGCMQYQEYVGPEFAQGGAGIVLSRAAFLKFISVIDQCIITYDKPGCVGSVRVALCLRELLDIKLDRRFWHNFNSMAPNRDLDWRARACDRPMSFHHVTQMQIQDLYRVDTVNPNNGLQKKYPDYTTFEDVYSYLTYSDNTFLKGQEIVGGVILRRVQTKDARYCQKLCREDPRCMSWNCDTVKGICHIRDMIAKTLPNVNQTAGLMGSHYVCEGQGRYSSTPLV